jgi:hypothetical protein
MLIKVIADIAVFLKLKNRAEQEASAAEHKLNDEFFCLLPLITSLDL